MSLALFLLPGSFMTVSSVVNLGRKLLGNPPTKGFRVLGVLGFSGLGFRV